MAVPVSVIVPHQAHRKPFLALHTLPGILENDPAEILIEAGDGGACRKRNLGASKASQPFLFFCDDDCVPRPGCLRELMGALAEDPAAAFSYCDEEIIDGNHFVVRKAGPWDPLRLKRENYIGTMSLLRRETFPGFDPEMRRFQDWDLWLTMARAGARGVYVPRALVSNHRIDPGITGTVPLGEAMEAIRRKHSTEAVA